jgi:FkbM family methyltransferase
MTLRQQIGRLYRKVFRASRFLGFGRLPVCTNGRWTRVPIEMWDGLRVVYEPHLDQALRKLLKQGDVFFDIGAHFGIWSSLAADLVGPTGTVIACEPSPAFRVLEANLPRVNVRARNVAVGAAAGVIAFHAQGTATSGSLNPEVTAINRAYAPETPITAVQVALTTVDLLAIAEKIRPTVLKIDVEGYEFEVLKGATRVLAGGPACIIEIHPPQLALCGADEEQVKELLDQAGYKFSVIDRNLTNPLYTILATKRACNPQ